MRLLSFVIWAIVAAGAVFWLTRLLARPDAAPAHTVLAATGTSVAAADFSRLLGSSARAVAEAAPAAPAGDGRFKLVGVVAAKASAADSGLALIAVDGKPPRPVGLGGVVDGSLVLLAVNHRRAELGPAGGEPTVQLELPAAPEPNRSVRAPGASPLPPPPGGPVVAPRTPPPRGAAGSTPVARPVVGRPTPAQSR